MDDNTIRSISDAELYSDNKELKDKVSILNMIYEHVIPLSRDVIYCETGNDVYIVHKDGGTIAEGDKDRIKLVGLFLIVGKSRSGCYTIYSFYTNKKIDVDDSAKNSILSAISSVKVLCDRCLYIEKWGGVSIYDMNLTEIFKCRGSRPVVWERSKTRICIKYTSLLSYQRLLTTLDISSGKVESIDEFDIADNIKCVALKENDKRGISVNTQCDDYLKYGLSAYGSIVTNKLYEDITKPPELKNVNTFLVYELDSARNKVVGLIDMHGNELLQPIYSKIAYIGCNNYIVEYKEMQSLYSSVTGVTYNFGELKSITVHKTLPLSILYFKDNSVKLLNNITGKQFDVAEIAKQFKCSYNKADPTIIRIDLDFGAKYITNTLVPITNMHKIAGLNASGWVAM